MYSPSLYLSSGNSQVVDNNMQRAEYYDSLYNNNTSYWSHIWYKSDFSQTCIRTCCCYRSYLNHKCNIQVAVHSPKAIDSNVHVRPVYHTFLNCKTFHTKRTELIVEFLFARLVYAHLFYNFRTKTLCTFSTCSADVWSNHLHFNR